LSDATSGDVQAQDFHVDVQPVYRSHAFSVLINLSSMMSYLALVINSGSNIASALELNAKEFRGGGDFDTESDTNGEFKRRYLITQSTSGAMLHEVMKARGFDEDDVIEYAWSLHMQKHAEANPDKFKKMRIVYAGMKPFGLSLFDNYYLHGGPEFPMPHEERAALGCLKHFRLGIPAPFPPEMMHLFVLRVPVPFYQETHDSVGLQGAFVLCGGSCGGRQPWRRAIF
jgi:hypothetical protein